MYTVSGEPTLVHNYWDLIASAAKNPFYFGSYTSIGDILDKLGVNVVLETGIHKRSIPKELTIAEQYWEDEYKQLRKYCDAENKDKAWNDCQIAEAKWGAVKDEKRHWDSMTLRGCYIPEENVIKLYPDEMQTEYNGTRMNELIVSTLVHETMHAYFNRPGHEYPYAALVEEPLAEFGMLLYLFETNSGFYDWAKEDVAGKRTCYRYGAELMDKHLSAGQSSALRIYLEDYKIGIPVYAVPLDYNDIASISKETEISSSSTKTIYPHWRDVFTCPPRYFYDDKTKTLGLDGDWRYPRRDLYFALHSIGVHIMIHFDFNRHSNLIEHLYLGERFDADGILDVFSSCEVIVSPANTKFFAKQGVLCDKKNNEIFLHSCGDGLYKICRKGKWGVIDDQLNQVIPNKYDDIWSFDKNDLMVEVDSHYGLVNKQGSEQIPLVYDHIKLNDDGSYTVKKDGREFRIDKDGNAIE